MAATGQPKDPDEALRACRPLMFVGEDEEDCVLALGHRENVVAEVFDRDDNGDEFAARLFADDVVARWNLHHDRAARIEALETALRGLLPLAQERASQFREYAKKLAEFIKKSEVTPEEALEASLKLRQTEAAAAELVLEQARQALKGDDHG